MNEIHTINDRLLNQHGPQGWWPLLDVEGTEPNQDRQHARLSPRRLLVSANGFAALRDLPERDPHPKQGLA